MTTACPVCGRDCRNPANLASHLKSKHADYLAPDKPKPGPKPKPASKAEAYDRKRAWDAENSRRISAAGRDIAPLPEVTAPAATADGLQLRRPVLCPGAGRDLPDLRGVPGGV